MKKLSISLSQQELRTLAELLDFTIRSQEVETLKRTKRDIYLAFACLLELHNRLEDKVRELDQYGAAAGKKIQFSLRRIEAIGFYNIWRREDKEEESYLPAVPIFTQVLIQRIIGDIDQHYFV